MSQAPDPLPVTQAPIRPFISSTFRDFQEERNYLVKRVFPVLENLALSRGSYFAPVDLRWGINKRQSESGQVLQLCLDYIQSSSPYFMCLLGERYGSHRDPVSLEPSWLDINFDVAGRHGFDWITSPEVAHKSVTELEIMSAALGWDEASRQSVPARVVAFFYFRDVTLVERSLAERNLSCDKLLEEKMLFAAESAYAEKQMAMLKATITDTFTTRVSTFSTLEELGNHVLRDWTSVIEAALPLALSPPCDAKWESRWRERQSHEAFAESRRRHFVGASVNTQTVTAALDSHVMPAIGDTDASCPVPESRRVLCLTGPQGCGKTTVLASWTKSALLVRHSDVCVVTHFIGSSPDSCDALDMLQRCTWELRRHFSNGSVGEGGDSAPSVGAETKTFRTLCEEFSAALSLGPCVVVLDGLNSLTGPPAIIRQIADCSWLPAQLPRATRVIVATEVQQSSTQPLGVFHARKDVHFVSLLPIHEDRVKVQILTQYLQVHRKCLDEEEIGKITASCLSGLPLFLTALAGELRVFGVHEELSGRVAHYLKSTSLSQLYVRIIRRWAHDYGWDTDGQRHHAGEHAGDVSAAYSQNWVYAALGMLACARRGLSERELLALLQEQAYVGDAEVSSADWALFRAAAADSLIALPAGLISFSHAHVRDGISSLLVNHTEASPSEVASAAAETWRVKGRESHRILAAFFEGLPVGHRSIDELPWHLERCGEYQRLLEFVTQPAVFLLMNDHHYLDLIRLWNLLCKQGFQPGQAHIRMMTKFAEVNRTAEAVELACKAGKFMNLLSEWKGSQQLLKGALQEAAARSCSKLLLVDVKFALASCYRFQLNNDVSERWYLDALQTLREYKAELQRSGDATALSSVEETAGWILDGLGKLKTMRMREGEQEPAKSEARQHLNQARQCLLANPLGLASVEQHLGVLCRVSGEWDQGEQHIRKSLEIRQRWYGSSHPEIAFVLNDWAQFYSDRNNPHYDPRRAEELSRTTLQMREEHLGTEHLLVATTLFHLAKTLMFSRPFGRARSKEAQDMLRRALAIRTKVFGADHELAQVVVRQLANLDKRMARSPNSSPGSWSRSPNTPSRRGRSGPGAGAGAAAAGAGAAACGGRGGHGVRNNNGGGGGGGGCGGGGHGGHRGGRGGDGRAAGNLGGRNTDSAGGGTPTATSAAHREPTLSAQLPDGNATARKTVSAAAGGGSGFFSVLRRCESDDDRESAEDDG